MAAITQTITIVDKSNKVVTASKQLKNVFVEAKYAYQARKAEIKAERKRREEVELQKAIQACSIAEDEARSQSARSHGTRRRRDDYDRYESRDQDHRSYAQSSTTASPRHMSLGEFNQQLYGQQGQSQTQPRTFESPYDEPSHGLLRRRTDLDYPIAHRPLDTPQPLNRSYSATDIDLDLAYGEFHEPDLAQSVYGSTPRGSNNELVPQAQEKELGSLVLRCKKLLDEADCAGQSVKAIVAHLQGNPDAMAAVALTLAEISNIASKVAPTALTALKTSAPAVMALLASPEFLVAVGVGLGVTIVMFGGYKIIKKIKATATGVSEEDEVPAARQVDLAPGAELLDVKELDRIENWRRGIADSGLDETGSVVSGYSNATSVEGEFITPFAAQSMGHLPVQRERHRKHHSSSSSKKDKDGKERKKSSRRDRDGDSESGSTSGSHSSGSRRTKGVSSSGEDLIKAAKKPSPLRRMFTIQGASSTSR